MNIYFSFANLSCKVVGSKKQMEYIKKSYQKSPFRRFISNQKPKNIDLSSQLNIKIISDVIKNTEQFILESNTKSFTFNLKCSENLFFVFPVIEQVLRKIFYIMFFKTKGFILHSSGVVLDRKAYLFSGSTGAGKSTLTFKLKKENKKAKIIADNNVYLKKINEKYYVFPPPFLEWNFQDETLIKGIKYEVERLHFIEKSNRTEMRTISLAKALQKIFSQIQMPSSLLTKEEIRSSNRLIFDFVSHLQKKDGIGILQFSLGSKVEAIALN